MKVRIGNFMFDGALIPIMVELNKKDKLTLSEMDMSQQKVQVVHAPKGYTPEILKEWVNSPLTVSETEDPPVILSKELYAELQERISLLDALECAGVDNWGGYSYAMEILHEGD